MRPTANALSWRGALSAVLLLTAMACGTPPKGPAAAGSPDPGAAATAPTSPLEATLTAAGIGVPRVTNGRFTRTAFYVGECAGGGRGGCYAFTFKPNGVVHELLLDATMSYTYRVEGDVVTIGEGDPARTLRSADGLWTFDAYRYSPSFVSVVGWASVGQTLVCRPDGGTLLEGAKREEGTCSVDVRGGAPAVVFTTETPRRFTLSADAQTLTGDAGPMTRLVTIPDGLSDAPDRPAGPE